MLNVGDRIVAVGREWTVFAHKGETIELERIGRHGTPWREHWSTQRTYAALATGQYKRLEAAK